MAMLATRVGWGQQGWLWRLPGLSCGQADLECCSSYRGRLETTRVLMWFLDEG